jgi:hypothetical protein
MSTSHHRVRTTEGENWFPRARQVLCIVLNRHDAILRHGPIHRLRCVRHPSHGSHGHRASDMAHSPARSLADVGDILAVEPHVEGPPLFAWDNMATQTVGSMCVSLLSDPQLLLVISSILLRTRLTITSQPTCGQFSLLVQMLL